MTRIVWTILVLSAVACAKPSTLPPAASGHDTPVPATEERRQIRLVLDLNNTSTCEEDFDLSLYPSRAIDLVEWDDAEGCVGRVVTVRYFPSRASQDQVVRMIQELAVRVEEPKP